MKQEKFLFSENEIQRVLEDFYQQIKESKEDKEYLTRTCFELELTEEAEINSDDFKNAINTHETSQYKAEKWIQLFTNIEIYRKFLGDKNIKVVFGPLNKYKLPLYIKASKEDNSMPIMFNDQISGEIQ